MIIHSVHAIIKVTEVLNVKITMISGILNLIAPDHCYSCGKTGGLLCDSCVYDIISEPFGRCLLCLVPTADTNLCSACRGPLARAWVCGERAGVLEKLANDSKFSSNRRGCVMQAALLDSLLPALPVGIVIAPIPTVWPHIRQRGYGHAELIAKTLAERRDALYSPLLIRATNSVQHGANRRDRLAQAKQAYKCDQQLDGATILLVDDVCTTGASLLEAAKVLRSAGANNVWAAVTTRQLLDT